MTLLAKCMLAYLGILNFLGFVLCGMDKWKAQHNRWRIPERVLFGISFLGGGPGFFMGMQLFRHKTRHWSFKILIPLSIVLWAVLLVTLQYRFGVWSL